MNKSTLSSYTYIGYFFIGLISIMFAPVLPLIIKEFGISLTIAGSIFPVRFAGTFLGTLAGGILSDYYGRKPVLIFGSLIQALALFGIASSGEWIYSLIFFGVAGIGVGVLNTTMNALTSDINTGRKGAALNILHGVYAMGCLLGPVIAGFLLVSGYGWRIIFYGSAIIWFLYSIGVLFITYPKITAVRNKGKTNMKKSLFLSPLLLMLFAVSFIYNGSATGLVGWINTYMDQMNFSLLLGSGMVSVFYAGLTGGRFICGKFSDKIGFSKIILICGIGSFIFFPMAVFTNQAWLIATGVFFTGLFMSGLHPTGLAYANTLYPEKAGTVTAILSTSMSLGAMSVPWLIGIVADVSGFKVGMSIGFSTLFVLVLIGVGLVNMKTPQKQAEIK